MTENQLKRFLSASRFNIYLSKSGNDFDKAYRLYKVNIELSEAFYPIMAVLEVSLRNSIHDRLTDYFKNPFWFVNILPAEFSPYVSEAMQKVVEQRKNVSADRIVAELHFGFWNKLFNRSYAKLLWKPLRVIFRNMPKSSRQRAVLADVLYRARTLRNRIYHYDFYDKTKSFLYMVWFFIIANIL